MNGVDMAITVIAIILLAVTLWYAAWESWDERRWQTREEHRRQRQEQEAEDAWFYQFECERAETRRLAEERYRRMIESGDNIRS